MKKIFTFSCLLALLALFSMPAAPAQQRGITVKQGIGFTATRPGSSAVGFDIGGGLSQTSSRFSYDTESGVNFLIESGVGFRFNRTVSIDFSFLYFRPQFEEIDEFDPSIHSFLHATSYVFLLNGYINPAALFHHYLNLFDPYIGVGVGVSRNQTDNTKVFKNDTQVNAFLGHLKSDFSYRLIVGLNFHITRQLLAFVQYSYLDAGSFTTSSSEVNIAPTFALTATTKPKLNNHNNQVVFGLLYLFNLPI